MAEATRDDKGGKLSTGTDLLRDLQQDELTLGDRGMDVLPKNYYLLKMDASESEVRTLAGHPALALSARVEAGEFTGRRVQAKTTFWYESDKSKSDTPPEERRKFIRSKATQSFMGYVYQVLGGPEADEDLATAIREQILALDTDDEEDVEASMEALIEVLNEVSFIGRVKIRSTDDGDFAEFEPFVNQGKGKERKAPSVETLMQSWAVGLDKCKLVDEAELEAV